VGAEALRKAEADPWIAERLKENFDLYAKLTTQNIRMPKLLLHTDVMMHGTAADTGSFVQEMERQFDLIRSGTPVIKTQ
jgi:hypothetical protein